MVRKDFENLAAIVAGLKLRDAEKAVVIVGLADGFKLAGDARVAFMCAGMGMKPSPAKAVGILNTAFAEMGAPHA